MSSAVIRFLGVAFVCMGAVVLPGAGRAADVAAPPETSSDWIFTGALYGWAAGLDGEAGLFGQPPVDLDLSFGDLVENLDIAVMGLGEARNGPFVLGMDATYLKLSASADTDPATTGANSIDITTTSWMVTGFGGYSLFEGDVARLDAIAGARLWSVDTELQVNSDDPSLDGQTEEDAQTWVDPLVGAKLYVAGWAMIGGFGVGSDLMWDLMGGAGYDFTEHFSAFAGYRAASVDYSNDGFVYDVVEQGPVVAAVFKF